ncbi:uncharacterized protein [Triticum aestivum]|uniref:uncharacterized protein isoform X1 n=1 Tax=Triticum aestivum TaxID=4565 RepID=UPI001D0305E5|nr:uncharacterized protein LOC123188803 isoform X1 [Triticum aestivum]XP_044456988.1 uncharacterized protein LOC123188803 isoform X1 [Triticum aestivum]XP_044456989.1 uncharacterized protein LOC123188803 isoform X1 [Triticum aestivum]XP_044456990.1 uncharacterized protein LOC123188803 isoform X1 [Triticum aestivum]XP_044456991.1 uncharacterized protein LOC123188803 isoform X1 [Triticum aestivum]XP_044456992.1 uncharacterized protein LOC123188803 isoform X1 [Triticum aestivum]XP_044456993.1 un
MTGVKQKPHPRRKSRKVQQPKNSPKEKLMKEPAGQDTDERSDLQVGSVVDPVLPSAKFEPEPPTVPLLTGDSAWLYAARGLDLSSGTLPENLCTGGVVTSYIIEQVPKEQSPDTLCQGSFKFQHDNGGTDSIRCSFKFAKSVIHAMELYSAAIRVSSPGLGKIYFTTYCVPLACYIVVYEPLLHYDDLHHNKKAEDSICNSNKIIKKRWLANIRNIYEGLDLLHSLRISHPLTNKVFSYMWCKTEDGSIGSVKLIGANGSMQTMTKHNNTVSRERDERADVLHFLEKLRIAECPDYPSFRWLVENSVSAKAILGHPLLTKSDEAIVDVYYWLHESVLSLDGNQRSMLQNDLNAKFPTLANTWRNTVKSSTAFVGVKVAKYYDDLLDLLRFVRNYIEHKRDEALYIYSRVNHKNIVVELSKAFPTFLAWVYTYIKLF